jgi:type II secretory pathway pseudopilin PulG
MNAMDTARATHPAPRASRHATAGRGVPRRALAFTLLEAMIALAMLAGVFGVCLGLRSAALAADRRAAALLQTEREADALFQMVINRTLLDAEPDSTSERMVWIGTHLGEPYRIERTVAVLPNPLVGRVPHPTEPELALFSYSITYKGHTTQAYWHR